MCARLYRFFKWQSKRKSRVQALFRFHGVYCFDSFVLVQLGYIYIFIKGLKNYTRGKEKKIKMKTVFNLSVISAEKKRLTFYDVTRKDTLCVFFSYLQKFYAFSICSLFTDVYYLQKIISVPNLMFPKYFPASKIYAHS